MRYLSCLNLLLSILFFSCETNKEVALTSGLLINESTIIKKGTYLLPNSADLASPIITLSGNNMTIDFNDAILQGHKDPYTPDQFKGLGILIKDAKNITIKNLKVKGFKIGLMAIGVDSLTIENSDLSYNYRKRLGSTWDREDFEDWMSYHNNENDEWHRYGAAMYLDNCNYATIRNVVVTQGQNALLMNRCNYSIVYNNDFSFNSALGIGMYRSSSNKIMHNKLDWNIRGFVYGRYNRGQDSSGILAYEQSSNNTFAYNSATHSGDGFFLWAGQTTMDSGQGGCNDNLVFGNDFSYASNNGVEITFSSNQIINNKMVECDYGVWGGYSHKTMINDNYFENNNHGIGIEHGQDNAIDDNTFVKDKEAIWLWERASQPAGWGFAEKRNVESKNYKISNNVFTDLPLAFKINGSKDIDIEDNTFVDVKNLLLNDGAKNRNITIDNNKSTDELKDSISWQSNLNHPLTPKPIADAQKVYLPKDQLKGRPYILVNEWGPYNFQYPTIWLRSIEDGAYTFALFGPEGNWKVTGGEGFKEISRKSGAMPATIVATQADGNPERMSIALEYIGESVTTQFGDSISKGEVIPFEFNRFEKSFNWEVKWYEYDKSHDLPNNFDAFQQIQNSPPLAQEQTNDLSFVWWRKPHEEVQADSFATFCESIFQIEKGEYEIALTSDDGAKLILDGKTLIDHWEPHEPVTDRVVVELGGEHRIQIMHYEIGGLANLVFQINPILQ